MASKLNERDKLLLNAYQTKKVGDKPYENGYWGNQGSDDFAYLEIYDESENLVEFSNLSTDKFSINQDNSNLNFYIGNHLRDLGFLNGIYTVNYRFFRKLAGDESAVLVRNKSPFEGELHTSNFYIHTDGKVYAGTEEEFRLDSNVVEQLSVEDLKYQIDVISGDRTEVRLKAKNIKGKYTEDFVNVQTAVRLDEIEESINFQALTGVGAATFESNILKVSPNENGFLFTQKMKDGTVSIPGVFKVNEIEVPNRTETNVIQNSDFELTQMDSYGNEITFGDNYGWDAALHSRAISPNDWSVGYRTFGEEFEGTEHIGYHGHFVRGEGVTGGVCLKFPDTNESYTVLDEWPSDEVSRLQSVEQTMLPLTSNGVSRGDIVNVAFDLKGSLSGRGVAVRLLYPTSPVTEEVPANPPLGYYDPLAPPPSEPLPTDPPLGFVANTSANAQNIENQPPAKYSILVSSVLEGLPEIDLGVGDTTSFWGGEGAWIITNSTSMADPNSEGGGGNPIFTWSPNLVGPEYSKVGSVSPEQEWVWSGTHWNSNPEFTSPYPVAPNGTVSEEEFPNAVNTHPFQIPGNGKPRFKRSTARELNSGFQAATPIGGSGGSNALFFKDDLIWKQRHADSDVELSNFDFYTFDSFFPGTEDVVIESDGPDNGRTIYQDIFENGFIQSVTRVPEGGDDGVKDGRYLIFYNNGDLNSEGQPTEDSNRYFYVNDFDNGGDVKEKGQDGGGRLLYFLRDIDGGLNQKCIDNDLKMAWFYKHKSDSESGTLRYYIYIDNKYYRITDGDNGGNLEDGGIDGGYPKDTSDGFPGLPQQPDAIIGKSQGFGRYRAIIEDQVYRYKSNAGDGVESPRSMSDEFFRVGERGYNGEEFIFGSRNPSADNYNSDAIYDDGSSEFSYDTNPKKEGALSPQELWKWDGNQWVANAVSPPRFNYQSVWDFVSVNEANLWERKELEMLIPDNWLIEENWKVYFYGHSFNLGNTIQGISWVDNVFMDFTLVDSSVTREVYRPYTAQIVEVSSDGLSATMNRSYKEAALELGVEDENPDTDVFDISNPPENGFEKFRVTYTNLNPFDLRTYLKFDSQLFLTTNFKQDKINVDQYPHAVVYKLYEPLPSDFEELDECVIVKEMAEPLVETVNIIDFIPAEEGKLVLRSPDFQNVESPIRARATDFKNENEILTDDATISTELKNEFLSQSLDSVELNIEHARYENFINFSSVEKRIRNFQTKLKQIESYNALSSSYIGVSGSAGAIASAEVSITEIKNNFDHFEKYMYFESSSYSSGSLGIFYDNAWPKASGEGTLRSPYVLETVDSTNGFNWFNKAVESASLYDAENKSRLSENLPAHITFDNENEVFVRFIDMIGQHFDSIWVYIKGLTDTFDRREKLTEGISKDLLYSVGRSLGWTLDDGKDLIDLPKYALGKEVTGSAYSDYSVTSERDISREIWSRIINNMPFFLKNKGTVGALKGLINIYGIPSTILRVKEYGGPDLEDDASPQFEITRKFTKALDFKGEQYVKTSWVDDTSSGRKPDTIEFRFRAVSSSNQILVNKNDDFILRLKDNGSTDNYGSVNFILSGSSGHKEISSSALPVYDGDFYSVMLSRSSGSDSINISQSYQLNVGKYDSSRSKIHLYSTSTMDITGSLGGFNANYTASGHIYIGGEKAKPDIGSQLTGSVMEYRHWTETLNTGSFKNHIANPKAYDGNSVSSSYENLVLRYSFDDNKSLTSDTEGIRDVSSNQTATLSGSHNGFTGNPFRSVVDQQKSFIPSIGALRRTTNKVRIEDNSIKPDEQLSPDRRATNSAFDTSPNDSNKVGIFFAPTDVINRDIIDSVGNLNFGDYLGDPRDQFETKYRGLERVADNYWKKYTAPNNFWDYIRLIKYYDQSMFGQLRKLIPARAKPDLGILVEPNIFERPKVQKSRKASFTTPFYSQSIDISNDYIVPTASFNIGAPIRNYDAYTGEIGVFTYGSGSVVSASGEYLTKEATGSEVKDNFTGVSIWQRLNTKDAFYASSSITFGDVKYNEARQPVISGSRIYGRNQKTMAFYSSSFSASLFKAYSSSFYNVDLDNLVEENTALFRRAYGGVKNTKKTTIDNQPPIEVIITSPTKLVSVKDGESTLDTGEGIISEFKDVEDEKDKFDPVLSDTPIVEEPKIPGKPKPKLKMGIRKKQKFKYRGLKGLSVSIRGTEERPITDADIKREKQKEIEEEINKNFQFESTADGKGAKPANPANDSLVKGKSKKNSVDGKENT
tara:strand:- start:3128 stop:9856 length:6729 start_codon:yes stop_codon:yes gene_type:complete